MVAQKTISWEESYHATISAMENCIFCKIVKRELPSRIVYEDEKTLAFLDIRPVNGGHTLVIPKNPSPHNIFDVSEEDWLAIANTVRKMAKVVEKATDAGGINIMMNNGDAAGPHIREHLHVHIIPRFKDDGLQHWTQRPYEEGEAELIMSKIEEVLRETKST